MELRVAGLTPHSLILFFILEIAVGVVALSFPFEFALVILLAPPILFVSLLRPFYAYLLGIILLPIWTIAWTGARQIPHAVDIRFADIAFVIGTLGLMVKMASDRDFRLRGSSLDFPLILLFSWMGFSLFWTSDLSAGIIDYIKKIYGLGLFYLTINLVRDRHHLDTVLKVWILTGLVWGIIALHELVSTGLPWASELIPKLGALSNWGERLRSSALAETPNKLGAILSFSLFIAFAQYAISRERWIKSALFLAIIVMFMALITTMSRTTWAVFLLVSMLLFIRVGGIRRLSIALGVAVILIFFVVTTSAYREALLQRAVGIIRPTETPDYIPRLNIYAVGLRMFQDRPLNGVGVGSFHLLASSYGSIKLDSPHNIFVYIISEFGLVGLGLFFFLIMSFIITMKDSLKGVSGNEKIVLYSLVAIMTFYLLQSQIISVRLRENYMWILLGVVMAAVRIFSPEAQPHSEPFPK